MNRMESDTRPTLAGETRPTLAGYRLLIVEDDYFVAQDLSATLRQFGATVLGPAPDTSSARQLHHELRADCVLLDINLDGGHAFDLAWELTAAGTPVVFTTGYDSAFVPEAFRSSPCLQKPLDAKSLLRSISEYVPHPRGGRRV